MRPVGIDISSVGVFLCLGFAFICTQHALITTGTFPKCNLRGITPYGWFRFLSPFSRGHSPNSLFAF